jgi:hypothetical protein
MSDSEHLKKYEELYSLTKSGLSDELEAIRQLEEKSSRYISVAGLVLGVSTLGLKYVIDSVFPCKTALDNIVVLLLFLFLALAFASIVTLFTVFKTRDLSHFPINNELLQFFDQNNYLDSIFALARGNIEAVRKNRAVRLDKIRRLSRAYKLMFFSIVTLALFTCSIVARQYLIPSETTKRSYAMAEQNQDKPSEPKPSESKPPSSPEPKPNPSVKPPTYDTVQKAMPNPNVKPPTYEEFNESYDPKAGKPVPPPPDAPKKDE